MRQRTSRPAETSRTDETPNEKNEKKTETPTRTNEHELTKTAHTANATPPRHDKRQAERPVSNEPPYDTPKRTNETRGGTKSGARNGAKNETDKTDRRRDEERNGESGSRGGMKSETKTIHNTDTKKPQEKHTTTSCSAHDTKKTKNEKNRWQGNRRR